jgi:hypothetical protein
MSMWGDVAGAAGDVGEQAAFLAGREDHAQGPRLPWAGIACWGRCAPLTALRHRHQPA